MLVCSLRHGWNLTVLPNNSGSILRHLGAVPGEKTLKKTSMFVFFCSKLTFIIYLCLPPQGWPFPGWTLAWSFLPHAGLETKIAFHILITYTLVLIAFGECGLAKRARWIFKQGELAWAADPSWAQRATEVHVCFECCASGILSLLRRRQSWTRWFIHCCRPMAPQD